MVTKSSEKECTTKKSNIPSTLSFLSLINYTPYINYYRGISISTRTFHLENLICFLLCCWTAREEDTMWFMKSWAKNQFQIFFFRLANYLSWGVRTSQNNLTNINYYRRRWVKRASRLVQKFCTSDNSNWQSTTCRYTHSDNNDNNSAIPSVSPLLW